MAISTAVKADRVEYASRSATIRAYLGCPDAGPWPEIVMIQENPGMTEHRLAVTRRVNVRFYSNGNADRRYRVRKSSGSWIVSVIDNFQQNMAAIFCVGSHLTGPAAVFDRFIPRRTR
jgi:hypothetical protein